MPKIPDRWLDYTNVGNVIQGTRLITFKVPLQQSFFGNGIPEDSWFTPNMLIESIEEKGLKIGLIIDLTFTKKYYKPKEFTAQGIQYEKIFVPGHIIPSEDILDHFCDTVENFLKTNDQDLLIGVHCTHGVNRTGYVVCRYMVDRLNMKASEALEAYASARGYPVERENYIHDLKVRSGEASSIEVDEVTKDEGQNGVKVEGQYTGHSNNHKDQTRPKDKKDHKHEKTHHDEGHKRKHGQGHKDHKERETQHGFNGHSQNQGYGNDRDFRPASNHRNDHFHRRGYYDGSYESADQFGGWSSPRGRGDQYGPYSQRGPQGRDSWDMYNSGRRSYSSDRYHSEHYREHCNKYLNHDRYYHRQNSDPYSRRY